MPKYTTIQLPSEFVEQMIEPLMQARWGFTSRADVVREAVKLLWEKYMGKGHGEDEKNNKTLIISGKDLRIERKEEKKD